ncbi:MAG TPA: sterol carrier protein domain-containing protein, partial [Trueperaceae bacterium]|nr:sterol carrier protein domain-containing protein [Trueperaceae bacterium]
RDDDCPWNHGLFEVELTRSGCLARRTSVEGTRARVAMGIGALAALLFGATDPATALATGLAEGDLQPLVDLSRLLAGHPSYIPESDHY